MKNPTFSLQCLFYGNCLFLISFFTLFLHERLYEIVLISSISLCLVGFIRLYISESRNEGSPVKIINLTGVLSVLSLLLLLLSLFSFILTLFNFDLFRMGLISELKSLWIIVGASCLFIFTIMILCMAMFCEKMEAISKHLQTTHESFLKAQREELLFHRISESWSFSCNLMLACALFRFIVILAFCGTCISLTV